MESRGFDPTLPLDFDGSSNMMDLPNVTFGNEPSANDLRESHTQSPGHGLLLPMVAKSNSGRMSPVRGRTMKEYDQQITELKKENFSLKLRIYFLEERMQQKYGDGEDVFKTNIELKVNVQSLKKELEDKQELLRKASQAIETLSSSQQSDIDTVRKSLEDQHHKYTEELRSDLQKALQDAEDAREDLEMGREKMNQLEVRLQQVEMEQQQSHITTQKLKDTIDMKEREVSALQLESDRHVRGLEDAQHLLRAAEAERDAAQQRVQQMEKDLQRRGRDVEQLSTALKDTSMIDGQSFLAPTHLQNNIAEAGQQESTADVVDDQQDQLGRLEGKVAELEDQLQNKDGLIGRLEDGLKEKDKAWKETTNQLQQLNTELEQEKQLGGRRDKTIQGLVSSLHKKEKEVTSAKAKLSKSETALKTLRAELHDAEMANHKDQLSPLQQQLEESENSNRRLQTQLDDANAEVESMIKSLGKKEGELAGFREQLQQANQALRHSEDALEGLQEQLEKERSQAHGRFDKQAQEYQRTLEDYMQQLEGKDSLMAHMTSQMRAKDQQLTSLMDLLTDENNKGQKALLQRLEDDLNRSTGTARNALEEKQAELDRKNRELREARQTLQDKGKELEQANLQLLNKQEELEKLELRCRQQGEAMAQLSNAVSKAQNSLEDAVDRQAQVLQEKDAIVQRLQKALAEKEGMVEELTNQSPAIDKEHQQLRAQLREKDQLIQELQTECVQASCEKEQMNRTSQARLQEKEAEIQALNKKQQKELLNRDQEIQQLMSQLNKKDLQLEGLESRMNAAEEQQREALDTMRRMLAGKDKTIEALVDSVGEKERLLRRSQQNLTEDAKAQLAEMDTVLAENSRLKRLLREKQEALEDEIRRRTSHDNRETRHSSYHETVQHTTNVDNAQVCRLLEEQIRETHALSDLLRQDRHDLLINLNSDHRSDSHSREEGRGSSDNPLQTELSAVTALCQRLQEGVERNQQLHQSLLGHTGRHTDHLSSGESSPEGDLFFRNPQQQRRDTDHDGCPGISSGGGSSSTLPVYANGKTSGDGASANADKPGSQKTSTLAVQTSPFLTHTLFTEGGPLARSVGTADSHLYAGAGEGETAQAELSLDRDSSQEQLRVLSRETSRDSLSSAASLSSAQLAGMSAPVLRDLISQLQEDLIAAAQQNSMLQRQLETRGQSPGGGSGGQTEDGASFSVADLQAQVESLKNKLKLKDAETAQLHQHLGLPLSSSSNVLATKSCDPADLQDQVHNLRQQVKDMNKINSSMRQQLAMNSNQGEIQEGFSPQVLASMAVEIEHLKAENAKLNSRLKQHVPMEGSDLNKNTDLLEGSLNGDVCDGNGSIASEPSSHFWRRSVRSSDSSQQSPQFPGESYSQELSRNTNHRTDSSLSQIPSLYQMESGSRPDSQSSQSDSEWTPRMMRSEGGSENKLSRLAKMKLNADSATSQPLVNVGRKLQESQEQVKSLEERLLATEGTVRYMSQRLRHYRSLLQASKGGGGQGGVSGAGLLRSQSESCLFPPPCLSLSLSCNNLHEAAQCAGRSMDGTLALSSGMDAALIAGDTKQSDSRNSRSLLDCLNQQIKGMKDRYSQDLEARKQELRQVAKQPNTQQEEDGGSDLSYMSAADCRSREVLRRQPVLWLEKGEGQVGTVGAPVGASRSRAVTLSEVSSCGSEWASSQRPDNASSSPDSHSNVPALPSPQEVTFSMTLGEDLPDGTALENLTYSSFSESILPLGPLQDHHDSAWSSPRSLHLLGGRAAEGKGGPGLAGQSGSDGGKARTQGRVGSQSAGFQAGDEGSAQNEASRLMTRVTVLTDMNRTLREELSVYDTLCRSMGVQVSAQGSVGAGSGESSGDESCDGEMRLLQLHLAELRRLRERMEQLDTEAHNAVQVTSLLNDQHISRITELEAALAKLRDELAVQQALAKQRHTTIIEHEHVISETKVIRERQEKEIQLLRDNLAALQECEAQQKQEQEAEVAELQQQIQALQSEVDESQQQVRELEGELEESQQRRQSYDVKFSKSRQHLQDLESQLSKVKRRVRTLEGDLSKSQQAGQQLEAKLSESQHQQTYLETSLSQSEERKSELEESLSTSQQNVQSLEEELAKLHQQNEDFAKGLLAEKHRSEKLEAELSKSQREKQELEKLASESRQLQEECRQQQQRAQHYQERMAHYEQCMRDYQLRVQDCETQVEHLQNSLQSSQSKEQTVESKLQEALAHNQLLHTQLKEAESHAHTSESIAHRADTLARTLEGRLRELEGKVKETEDRAKETEYELRISQSTTSEINVSMDSLKRELAERSSKLKKRDAQLKKLVEEYKKVVSSQKETSQLNQTLKTEIRLYESMHCQTELSHDKKEELMRQLLSELSQTRRLAEDLISRLEHCKRNDSPASTGGPEAADGRPSPEPRDSLHHMLSVSETNILRVHTDSHNNSTADSQASSVSARSDAGNSDSPVSTPLGSEGSGRFGSASARPKTLIGATSPEREATRGGRATGQTSVTNTWQSFVDKERGGRKGSEDLGHSHLRSYSHPTSLKYWQDRHSLSLPTAGPRVDVDSDVRRLFAVSGLEGYEKLRRENAELLATLSSMQARMTERLKSFTGVSISESVEYSTLRELQMSAQNLRICAEEEGRLLSCFWLTQLPPLNARGEFYDPKLAEENENLKVELRKQKSRYDLLAHTVREQQERLHATNALRKKWETTLYKQYEHFLKHQLTTPAMRAAASVPPFVSSLSDGMEGTGSRGS